MRKIDINTWERKTQYENFINYDYPVFSICTRVDVTNLVNYCNKTKRSFFTCFLYIVTKCINNIDEFKTRIVNDEVLEYDNIKSSFIVLNNNKQIVTAKTSIIDGFEDFYKANREAIHKARENKDNVFNDEPICDCIYVSYLSWMDLHSINNPYNFSDVSQTSIPRITWGKCVEKDGKYEIGFDVSLHHALADGYHVALLINAINNEMNNF